MGILFFIRSAGAFKNFRLDKGGWSTNTTLFRNPDGSTVAVVMNPFDFEKDLTLEGQTFRIPARSFATVLF